MPQADFYSYSVPHNDGQHSQWNNHTVAKIDPGRVCSFIWKQLDKKVAEITLHFKDF